MRVLITGGAGLLGAALVAHSLETGEHDITVMDIAETPSRLAAFGDRIRYRKGDVGHFSHVLDAVKTARPERIFHLGALLGFACEENPAEAMRVNAMGPFHVFEAARLFAVPQIIFASSITTFAEGLPARDLRDDYPQRPVNLYGVLKLMTEGLGRYYGRRHGIDFRSLRFPAIVGPGPRIPGIATYTMEMIQAAARGESYTIPATPETRVPVVHVRDCAAGLWALAEAEPARLSRRNYLIDGPKPTPSARELAKLVQEKFPHASFQFAPDPVWQPLLEKYALPIDDSPAREDWGWCPRYDFPAIIQDIADNES